MKTTFILATFSAVLLLTGCVGVVPLPRNAGASLEAGHEVSRAETSFIVPHQTTRAEVVSRMGTNYYESPRCAAVAYTWQYAARPYVWWWFLAGAYSAAGDGGYAERADWHGVLIAFAADGSVTAVDSRRLSGRKSLDTQLEAWAVRSGAASKIPQPAVASK